MSSDIFILCDLVDLTEIVNEPLKQTQRIKYTCFDASQNYYVFGASSGGIYLFQRIPNCIFLQLIPTNYGAINLVAISLNEKFISFSTAKGNVCLFTINISDNLIVKPQLIKTIKENTIVTCFYWGNDEKQLFVGDKNGNVTLITITMFMGRRFHVSSHPILLLENPIVQISGFDKLLLVSTYTKCILCNTEKEEFKQIGNRPRDSDCGACFLPLSIKECKIYCARPGSRLWEADLDGTVLQTHQFKQCLGIQKPMKIIQNNIIINGNNDKTDDNNDTDDNDYIKNINDNNKIKINEKQIQTINSLQFSKLFLFNQKYIFTYTENGFYIFNTINSSVLLWNNDIKKIHTIKLLKQFINIYTLTNQLIVIKCIKLQEYILLLLNKEKLIECCYLINNNFDYFLNKIKQQHELQQLIILKEFLQKNMYDDLLEKFQPLFNEIIIIKNYYQVEKQQQQQQQQKHHLKNIVIIENKFNTMERIKDNDINYDDNNDIVVFKTTGTVKTIKKPFILNEYKLNEDEKIIQNLYMIYKSSKISNTHFLERYANIFDKYVSKDIIKMLKNLEKLFIENGETLFEAEKSCLEIYFEYLKPELIWEIDDYSKEFIINGFVIVNSELNLFKCNHCKFPLILNKTCKYIEIGSILLQYLWSRKEYEQCYELAEKVPALQFVLCKFYIQEKNLKKIVPFVLTLSDTELFLKAIEIFDIDLWKEAFKFMLELTIPNNFYCLKCNKFNLLNDKNSADSDDKKCQNNYNKVQKFTWNYFLNNAIKHLSGNYILSLITEYSDKITNDDIGREFYLNCFFNSQ